MTPCNPEEKRTEYYLSIKISTGNYMLYFLYYFRLVVYFLPSHEFGLLPFNLTQLKLVSELLKLSMYILKLTLFNLSIYLLSPFWKGLA